MRYPTAALAAVAVVIAVAGCTTPTKSATTNQSPSAAGAAADSGAANSSTPLGEPSAAVALVPAKAVGKISPKRLAAGLVPPTNRWFSGLVFPDKPQPVFPMPLSAALTDTDLSVGLPQVTASAKTIMGGNNPQVRLGLGAKTMKVTGYDTLTVTATYSDAAGKVLGSVLIAQGSPFVTYTAAADQTLPVEPIFKPDTTGLLTAEAAGRQYGLVVGGGATVDAAGKVALHAGSTVTVFAAPDGAALGSLAAAAAHPVVGGSVSHAIENDSVTTTFNYRTKDGGDTVTAPMAGQKVQGQAASSGSYPSIYGSMALYPGARLVTTAPLVEPSGALDVSKMSAGDKRAVVAQLRTDAAKVDFAIDDTYFGGKILYRAANMLTLAEQLGVDDVAGKLRSGLTAELTMWFDPKGCATRSTKCFVYDRNLRSIIGLKASFGSDELNDHHFHYGYLLYAAAVVAKNDPALATKIAPVADLVAKDIASSDISADFPQYRNFDPYAAHSWASGSSPFADGNNQESSSEAVNAWNALALWQQVRGNTAGFDQARWMMSVEANSAKLYWTDTDLLTTPAFTHKIVALNWGGKRDYATWFSPEPGAMLGIQLIPMGPYAQYLAGDATRIKANLAEAAPDGYGAQFGEYMVQYLALADPAAARQALASLPKEIDNGTSKAFVMAWVFSRPSANA